MTDREKLIARLNASFEMQYSKRGLLTAPHTADDLISFGVTFAKDTNVPSWIPASEPPKEWRDENGDAINYLIFTSDIGIDIGNWIEPMHTWFCLGVPFNVTHWMPLPEPPEEEHNEQ